MLLIDLSGQRFGMLTAIERTTKQGRVAWRCHCDCGQDTVVIAGNLGRQKSCGCLRRGPSPKRTHGEAGGKLYRVYYMMRHRCTNPKSPGWKYYGGKGVTLCDEWQTFEPFRDWARANGYREGLTIERKNSALGYNPDNCEWITRVENIKRMHKNPS
jgi:hypothetical protein